MSLKNKVSIREIKHKGTDGEGRVLVTTYITTCGLPTEVMGKINSDNYETYSRLN